MTTAPDPMPASIAEAPLAELLDELDQAEAAASRIRRGRVILGRTGGALVLAGVGLFLAVPAVGGMTLSAITMVGGGGCLLGVWALTNGAQTDRDERVRALLARRTGTTGPR